MNPYIVSAEAQRDLFAIWSYIAQDDVRLANRIDEEFHELFVSLAHMPGQGHKRKDITSLPVLFFSLYSYVVIYQPDTDYIRIIAVLRGKRDVKRILKGRT